MSLTGAFIDCPYMGTSLPLTWGERCNPIGDTGRGLSPGCRSQTRLPRSCAGGGVREGRIESNLRKKPATPTSRSALSGFPASCSWYLLGGSKPQNGARERVVKQRSVLVRMENTGV